MAGPARGALRSSARLSGGGEARAADTPAHSAALAAAARAGARAEAAARRARAVERAREVEDSPRELRDKCRRLARALRNAKHLVVYTGAGISTAADIPDYRGPRGVWTRLQRGETVGRVEVSAARPTLTHMALTALWARGTLKFVVSQNCDGLHVRAGLPRRALAELHGDMFAERCAACRRVYLRAFDTTERTARHAHGTRRLCHACGAELTDSIVHFGERGRASWPLNWAGALRHAAAADVVLCLGSSLKVLRRYPRLWRMHSAPHARPALYIVNLQWTPKDAVAALKINARCDAVMAQVARRLRLRVPRYSPRRDPLLAHAVPLAPPELHTTRRPLLRAPDSDSDSTDTADSPSASDSDDELPLRRLADRMRASPPPTMTPPAPPPPQAPPPPPPDLLHAFQVNMWAGDATILLRAQHAPSAQPRAAPPPPPPPPRRPLSDLRMFRIARRPPVPPPAPLNGHALFGNGVWPPGSRLRHLLRQEPCPPPPRPLPARPARIEPGPALPAVAALPRPEPKDEPKDEPKNEPKDEPKDEPKSKFEVDDDRDRKPVRMPKSEGESRPKRSPAEGLGCGGGAGLAGAEASALAAAFIARAVLLCRASLYPGLHTILAAPRPCPRPRPRPPSPERARPACAWCARHYAARRCQWYGAPPPDALAGRAWRRVRGRRYLCACCGEREADAARPDADTGGWYGKGYRKGRRRRR